TRHNNLLPNLRKLHRQLLLAATAFCFHNFTYAKAGMIHLGSWPQRSGLGIMMKHRTVIIGFWHNSLTNMCRTKWTGAPVAAAATKNCHGGLGTGLRRFTKAQKLCGNFRHKTRQLAKAYIPKHTA